MNPQTALITQQDELSTRRSHGGERTNSSTPFCAQTNELLDSFLRTVERTPQSFRRTPFERMRPRIPSHPRKIQRQNPATGQAEVRIQAMAMRCGVVGDHVGDVVGGVKNN